MSNSVEPIELCLESLDPAEDDRPYVRCVALAGSGSGLGLTAAGKIVWLQNETACLLIWVSADNRLIIQRRGNAARVRLTRAERFLDLPESKPVVTLHADVIEIEGHSFRVHVHGVAQRVAPPVRLALRRAQNWAAGALAAASLTACHTTPGGTTPPSEAVTGTTASTEASVSIASSTGFAQPPPELDTGGQPAVANEVAGQGGTQGRATTTRRRASKPPPPIEIRNHPPDISLPE